MWEEAPAERVCKKFRNLLESAPMPLVAPTLPTLEQFPNQVLVGELVVPIPGKGSVTWKLFDLKNNPNPDNWVSLKAVALPSSGLRMKRTNFWLSYHIPEARLSKGKAMLHLLNSHPDVYDWVLASMQALHRAGVAQPA